MIRVICVKLFFGQSLRGHQDRQRKSRGRTGFRRQRRILRQMDARFLNRDGRAQRTAAQRIGRFTVNLKSSLPARINCSVKLAPHADKLRTYENNVQRLGRFTAASIST